MVDLDALEQSILDEYRAVTAPPKPVAEAVLRGVIGVAPLTAAEIASTGLSAGVVKAIVGVAVATTLGGIGVWAVAGADEPTEATPAVEERASAPRESSPQTRPRKTEAKPVATLEIEDTVVEPPLESEKPSTHVPVRAGVQQADPPAERPTGAEEPTTQRPSARESLAAETRLVKQADRELRAGRLDAAAAAIRRYRDEFPSGVLGVEMDALAHIHACRRGQLGASESARRFVLDHSGGLAKRVQRACIERRK